ncbi:MAG TPA: hypothetical protein VMU32_07540 [Solirubrobacteraceae bacterium]|nr:hypothetical protein [Solirubrobacteraceae bacterium]
MRAVRVVPVALLLIGLLAPLALPGSASGSRVRPGGTRRAPVGPPLVSRGGGSRTVGAATGADGSSSAPASGGDPLVQNGLGSPLCADAGALSAASRQDCADSGFGAAAAPTGDYALDVHIDAGALGVTSATLEQDYLIGPIWMGLVWVAHAVVVALEWCFTLDLLDGPALVAVERSLRGTQRSFTQPWLVLALALASLAAAYDGLVRRRVAQTLGQAALMLAMMAGGLWVIADPAGTVGVLGRWADAAGAGTAATVVRGTPSGARRTLADGMGDVFAGVVGAPWCYMEFGEVRWCSEPVRSDPRLQAAALALAAAAEASGDCAKGGAGILSSSGFLGGLRMLGGAGLFGGGTDESEAVCEALAGESPAQLAQSARLLRSARSNGELFLALPANGAARNSIDDRASLLRALCDSDDATSCHGATAAEAEFRTQNGTSARLGGLLLIALGALGALLLLGYIALHLLGAELMALLYLLLAPIAVLAPALGDGGRGAFRVWAERLVGAVVAKLLFAFLLGVVLLLTQLLLGLQGFGWWTRWLLASAMWWGAFLRRHRLLGRLPGEGSRLGGGWGLRTAGGAALAEALRGAAARGVGGRGGVAGGGGG